MPKFPKPWYRKSQRRWFVTIRGKQTGLPVTDPNDREGAVRAVEAIKGAEKIGRLRYDALFEIAQAFDVAKRVNKPPEKVDPDAPDVRQGTLGELRGEYKAVLEKKVDPDTVTNYGRYLDWFTERFGKMAVPAIRPEDVEQAVKSQSWSDNTQRVCLTVIGKFVRWAGRPNFRVKFPPAARRGNEIIISPDEFEKLLSDARGDYKPLLQFMWWTWCRPGEARTLTVEMVDWSHGTITLKQHKTKKKGKQRLLLLCPESLAVLQAQRERYQTGPLFRNRLGRQFSEQAIKQRMRRLRKRVGVRDDAVNYSFRHTGATTALEVGASDTDVAAILGHSNTTMIHRHYSHVAANTKRLKEVVARVNEQRKS